MTSLATVRVIGLALLASPLVLVYFAAWIVCLRSASLNWMSRVSPLYTRYPIVARAWPGGCLRPSASREQRYLAYKYHRVVACHLAVVPASAVVRMSPDC